MDAPAPSKDGAPRSAGALVVITVRLDISVRFNPDYSGWEVTR
jgi:hypothetical protein